MVKAYKYILIIIPLIVMGFAVYLLFKPIAMHIKPIIGKDFPSGVTALLCYSAWHNNIAQSKTFFVNSEQKILSGDQYYLGVSHVFSDETVTNNFAVPLGYKSGAQMSDEFGQIIDYKNYKDAEVLVINDWRRKDMQFIIAYNKDGNLNTVKFPVDDMAYLGTCRDNNYVYVLINLEQYLSVTKINIEDNSYSIEHIPYTNFVRKRTDLSEANTIVKDSVIYVGEVTHENNNDTSSVTSYNLVTKEIKSISFDTDILYNLSIYNNNFIALFATGIDDIGYYQQIKYMEFDNQLNEIHLSHIANLPSNIDTASLRDRSIVYNSVLYTIINGINTKDSYLLSFDLSNKTTNYLAHISTNDKNRTLFDWEFLINIDGNRYNVSY